MVNQQVQVSGAFAEGRKSEYTNREAMEQVLSESLGTNVFQ